MERLSAPAGVQLQRDPLISPIKGDVIRWPNRFQPYEVAKVDECVYLFGRDRGRRVPMAYCHISKWPQCAKGATVLRAA